MKFVTAVAIGLLAGGMAGVTAQAVTFDKIDGPAEYPPKDFGGVQYVDSKGCVFMRAGYAGQTTWVPRVTRDRQVICGQTPTFAKKPAAPAAIATAPATPAPVAPAPRTVTQKTVTQKTVAPAVVTAVKPAPEPTVIASPKAAAQAPMATIASNMTTPQVRSVPAKTVAAPVSVVPSDPPKIVDGRLLCPNRSPVAQRLMMSDGSHQVRCVPQTEDPYTYAASSGSGSGSGAVPMASVPPITIPQGYKAAWTDGRLNPQRGPRTATGNATMGQVWTDQVPMQGKAVATRVASAAPASATVRAAPVAAPAPGGAYVQVGTYGVPSNASGAAARISAAGLPVARQTVRSGGRNLQVVLAGPLSSVDAASALAAVRRAGFRDAFIR